MRLSPCLLIAGLSSVHAFYPYEFKVERTSTDSLLQNVQRRFLPWMIRSEPEDNSNADPLVFGIKKVPVRRDYDIVESTTPSLAKSAALNQDGYDYSYFSVVEIGSEKKEMWLALDTGSPSTWVFGSECTDETCRSHHTFDKKSSASYISNGSSVTLGYGSGTIHGDLGQDTVSIADLNVTLSFGMASSASKAFSSYPIDGILGLGRSGTAGWTIPSFMDAVAKGKQLKSNLVGFSLSRASDGHNDGEVTFGNVDTSKFDGNITYTETNDDTWTIPVDDAYVNGKACGFSKKSATIDTGTTYFLIPPDDAKTIFDMIPKSSKSGESYYVPCDSDATLELSFSGVKYHIKPDDYIGSKSGDSCVSTIVSHQSSGENDWLVGDVFLKNVYSVFDFDNGQIGFGARNASSTSSKSTPGNGTFTAPSVTASKVGNVQATGSPSTSAAISENTETSKNSATRPSLGAGCTLLAVLTGMLLL